MTKNYLLKRTSKETLVTIGAEEGEEIRLDISIIIPLESHRGLAIECIKLWSETQTYSRDQYQLIIAAPNSLRKSIIRKIHYYLKPWDHLAFYQANHDISLVAEGAKLAGGEFLLFTESHCLPEPNALSHLLKIAIDNPEWAGFSSATIPIKHNLLSRIEADVYVKHINSNLENSNYLKVVDQCFLIKKEDYFDTKGFEPQYGGFAEFLLAASLHHANKKLGHNLTPVIKHYYIGNKKSLAQFTLDFAYGQAKFMAECIDDPRIIYFADMPELKEYHERTKADYRQMTQLQLTVFKRFLFKRFSQSTREPYRASRRQLVADIIRWLLKGGLDIRGDYIYAYIREILARQHLNISIYSKNEKIAYSCYIQWLSTLIHKGHLQYIMNQQIRIPPLINLNFPRSGRWRVDQNHYPVELLGFYEKEEIENRRFCWSMHCAAIYMLLHQGPYQIRLEWEPIRFLQLQDFIEVKFDGQSILSNILTLDSISISFAITSNFKGRHTLSWGVSPFSTPHDRRLLGLPLIKIQWFAYDIPDANLTNESLVNIEKLPIYFLHIHKCAGTSVRHIIDNAFSSKGIFHPYGGAYYAEDLINHQNLNLPYQFYRGHYRLVLPKIIQNPDLKIITILREPFDRITSYFHYLKQYNRINSGLELSDFIKKELKIEQTMTSHLISISDNIQPKEDGVFNSYLLKMLPEALLNLTQCKIIGIYEHLEDTINLIAWYFGLLPPTLLPRNNPTLVRSSIDEIPTNIRQRIEHLLESDIKLYKEAKRLFEISLQNMIKSLPSELGVNPTTQTIRSWLRERYILCMAEQGQQAPAPKKIRWLPDDIFHGENLHDREQLDTLCWRWTGPHEITRFFLYLGPTKEWGFTMKLHKATPLTHVESIRLYVNNNEVAVHEDSNVDHYLISARLPSEVTALHKNGVAEFQISTPIIRGENEFRMLGIALITIELQANDNV